MSSTSQFTGSSSDEYEGEEVCKYEDAFPKLAALDPKCKSFLSEKTPLPRLRSNLTTKSFTIPVELRSSQKKNQPTPKEKPELVFSKKTPKYCRLGYEEKNIVDKKLIKLCQSMEGNIDFSESLDGSLLVTVTCQENKYEEIKAKIKKNQEVHFTKKIRIPFDYHGGIKGAKGANVKLIEEETGTSIRFPPISAKSDEVEVAGPMNEVDIAIDRLMARMNQLYMNSYRRIEIPCKYHSLVLSKGMNAQLNSFLDSNQESCMIRVPPYSAQKDEIIISGERDLVNEAAEMIDSAFEFISKNASEMLVTVNKDKKQFLIKHRNDFVKEILEKDSVSILMTEKSDQILLVGKKSRFGPVITKVMRFIDSFKSVSLPAPGWIQKYVIGREGIRATTATRKFPTLSLLFKRDEGKIEIEGNKEDVEEVAEEFQSLVKSYTDAMSQVIISSIDSDIMKMIRTRDSKMYREVKRACGPSVSLTVDPIDSGLIGSIVLEGINQKVNTAKERIEAIFKEQINSKAADLIVEKDLFSRVIGVRPKFIRETRLAYPDVQVKFVENNDAKDSVKISFSGNRESVDQIMTQVKKKIRDAQLSNYSEKTTVLSSLFIGKKSVAPRISLGSLKSQFNVIIETSKISNEMTTLIVIGRQSHVQDCIQEIQQLNENQENLIETTMEIEPSMISYIIGQGGQRISSIRELSGGNVTFKFPPPNSSKTTVKIRGPKEQVKIAEKSLTQILGNANQATSSKQIKLPLISVLWHYKKFSQKGLMEMFSVNFELAKYPVLLRQLANGNTDKNADISLYGQLTSLNEAASYLKELVDNPNLTKLTLKVPEKSLVLFRDLQRQKDVTDSKQSLPGKSKELKLSVILKDLALIIDEDYPKGLISLVTPQDNEEEVKDLVQDVIAYIGEYQRDQILIGRWHVKYLNRFYSRHLATLRSVYQLKISIGNEPVKSEEKDEEEEMFPVVYEAHRELCEKIKQKISLWKPEISSIPIRENVNVNKLSQGRMIGLETDYKVFIVKSEESGLQIIGMRPDVEKVKGIIREIIIVRGSPEEPSRKKSKEVLEITIPGKLKRVLLGYRNRNLNTMRIDHNVTLKGQISNADNGDEDCSLKIEGTKQNIEAFSATINGVLENLKKMEIKDLIIPNRFHARLIGGKSKQILDLQNEYQVFIEFPELERKRNQKISNGTSQDTIRVIGQVENVELVENILLKEIERLEAIDNQRKVTVENKRKMIEDQRSSGVGSSLKTEGDSEPKKKPLKQEKTVHKPISVPNKANKPMSIIGGPWKESAEGVNGITSSWSKVLFQGV